MSDFSALKETAWRCNMELPRMGLVAHTFGNASVCDRKRRVVAIKPSGISYDALRPEDMVIIDLKNTVLEGEFRPSSDTRTHTHLYRKFPDIQGIVHTHSTYAVAWAQASIPVPILGTTHADFLPTAIPCTPVMTDEEIAGDYEEATGALIVRAFANLSPRDIPMVLVAGHGPFVWGVTPEKATYHAFMIEELCRVAFLTLQIRPDTPPLSQSLIEKHFLRKHGPGAYYGQMDAGDDETESRKRS